MHLLFKSHYKEHQPPLSLMEITEKRHSDSTEQVDHNYTGRNKPLLERLLLFSQKYVTRKILINFKYFSNDYYFVRFFVKRL